MNAAFTEEMKKDLEDCAYDEEDLVVNPYAKKMRRLMYCTPFTNKINKLYAF